MTRITALVLVASFTMSPRSAFADDVDPMISALEVRNTERERAFDAEAKIQGERVTSRDAALQLSALERDNADRQDAKGYADAVKGAERSASRKNWAIATVGFALVGAAGYLTWDSYEQNHRITRGGYATSADIEAASSRGTTLERLAYATGGAGALVLTILVIRR